MYKNFCCYKFYTCKDHIVSGHKEIIFLVNIAEYIYMHLILYLQKYLYTYKDSELLSYS